MVERKSSHEGLKSKTASNIEKYLSQGVLIQNVSSMDELMKRVSERKPLNIMMGQTFDEGQPLDLLKYAFVIMNMTDMLERRGVDVRSKWLIADHFITDINQDETREKVKSQSERRAKFLQEINNAFRGNIGVTYSSDLNKSVSYEENLLKLIAEAERNEVFRKKVEEAVPVDRRGNPKAYRYPLEELATIQSMSTDIKVGPPYERFYDEPAREIASSIGFNRYVAIHLTNSLPLGNPQLSSEVQREVGEFGVLPYKLDSKGLAPYRIDPINDTLVKTVNLVDSTSSVRALFDLIILASQAKQRLERNPSFSFRKNMLEPYGLEEVFRNRHGQISETDLRNLQYLASELYVKYLHAPLNRRRRLVENEY